MPWRMEINLLWEQQRVHLFEQILPQPQLRCKRSVERALILEAVGGKVVSTYSFSSFPSTGPFTIKVAHRPPMLLQGWREQQSRCSLRAVAEPWWRLSFGPSWSWVAFGQNRRWCRGEQNSDIDRFRTRLDKITKCEKMRKCTSTMLSV